MKILIRLVSKKKNKKYPMLTNFNDYKLSLKKLPKPKNMVFHMIFVFASVSQSLFSYPLYPTSQHWPTQFSDGGMVFQF